MGFFSGKMLEWVAIFFSGHFPDPGIKPTSPESPALQQILYPLSHQGSAYDLKEMVYLGLGLLDAVAAAAARLFHLSWVIC